MNENENDEKLISPLGMTFEEDNLINTFDKSKYKKGTYTKKQNFDKIIIPYNFKKNNYSVPDEEIDGYDNKE